MFDSYCTEGDEATFELDGFVILAKVERDEDPDLSWLGEFSESPEEGAIDHHETDQWLGRSDRGPRYFNPCDYALDYYLNEEKLQPEEAKQKADLQANKDYKRLVAYYQNEWDMVGVVVTASKAGVELGDVSLWGIESDSAKSFFKGLVRNELAPEAIRIAKKTLTKLCESPQ